MWRSGARAVIISHLLEPCLEDAQTMRPGSVVGGFDGAADLRPSHTLIGCVFQRVGPGGIEPTKLRGCTRPLGGIVGAKGAHTGSPGQFENDNDPCKRHETLLFTLCLQLRRSLAA